MDGEIGNCAVLIGLGSIGKAHLIHLYRYFQTIHIIDVNTEVFKNDIIDTRKTKLYSSFEAFSIENVTPDLCVIANWGPDHFQCFESLEKIGCKKFIIEKPLVSSLEDLDKIKNLKSEKNLEIFMNTPWIYSPIKSRLSEIQRDFSLGKILNLSVTGGAKCLVTNGIHYLALTIHLFEESPQFVWGKCKSSTINPRSKSFLFLEGTFNFDFGNMKFLNINFSNSSKIQAHFNIIFENGIGILDGDNLKILRNKIVNSTLDESPTRTHYPSEVLFDENPFKDGDGKDGMHKIYENILDSKHGDGFDNAYLTMKAIFLSLISNEKNSMPLDYNYYKAESSLSSKNWMIS
jgi:predicted dehydrogenase